MDMDMRTIIEVSQLVRECRALQHNLRKVLNENYFDNFDIPVSRRLDARYIFEGLFERIAELAETFGLPPYGADQSITYSRPRRRRRRRSQPTRSSLPIPDDHSE